MILLYRGNLSRQNIKDTVNLTDLMHRLLVEPQTHTHTHKLNRDFQCIHENIQSFRLWVRLG